MAPRAMGPVTYERNDSLMPQLSEPAPTRFAAETTVALPVDAV